MIYQWLDNVWTLKKMTPKYTTQWQFFEAWTQKQYPEKKDRYLVKNHFHYSAFTKNWQVMSPSVHLTFKNNSFHLFLLLTSQISIATPQKENTAVYGIRVLGENNSALFHPKKKKKKSYQLCRIHTKLLADNSLRVSHFCTFCKRSTNCSFTADHISKDVCTMNNLGRRNYFGETCMFSIQ